MKRFFRIAAISTLIVFILGLLVLFVAFPQKSVEITADFPKPTGPYLGQPTPGYVPERFAPGIINEDVHTAAVFSPDGTEVYWRPMDRGIDDILFTHWEEDGWTAPQIVPFASRFFDSDDPCFSPDGEKLFFTSWRPVKWYELFTNHKERIWYVERTARGWSKVQPAGTAINSMELHWQLSVAKSGALYFASEGDIYRSAFEEGGYSTPEQLGAAINTKSREGLPFIAPSESYLLFTSDKPGGAGDVDLYISHRDAEGSWSAAVNLGNAINSQYQELYPVVSPDGEHLFFLSNRNGAHSVYWVDIEAFDPATRPPSVTSFPTYTPTPSPTSTFTPTPPEPTPLPTTPSDSGSFVLFGTLIDGAGADPVPDAALVIQDRHITAVGPRNKIILPAGAQIIEIPNMTILPGFINAHVHNAYSAANLRTWAWEGVTTVRDVGAPWRERYTYFTNRDRLNQDPENARLVAAGPLVTAPGGYPIAGNNFPSLAITSPENAREQINRLIDDGADVIKITIESGAGPILSPEEASAIVETAHAHGVPVTAHVTRAADLQRALDAGVDDIAHAMTNRVSNQVIRQMLEENVAWVLTLEAIGRYDRDSVRRFIEAGGKVALGNDGGYLQGLKIGMPLQELLEMQEAGLTPMQIIVASTRNAARVCRLDEQLGTLEVGKIADLLVVDGDPLQDLRALEDVKLVIHSGVIIRDERAVSGINIAAFYNATVNNPLLPKGR